jgi:hypothetical protein
MFFAQWYQDLRQGPAGTRPRPRTRPRWAYRCPRLELLEDRTLLTSLAALASAQMLTPGSPVTGSLSDGGVMDYQLAITTSGRLTVQVHADGFATRLALLDSQGHLLVQSDGQSPAKPDDLIDQHVDVAAGAAATTYFLEVTGLAGGAGSYTLTSQFAPASAPFQSIGVGTEPAGVVMADFNGDGIPDLAVANFGDNPGDVGIFLGQGDGTFAFASLSTVGQGPADIVAGDFNHDGKMDLATVDQNSHDVSVLLGNGDGTFQNAVSYPVGSDGSDGSVASVSVGLVAGDFTGDGFLDLAVANGATNDISVLINNGDGTFQCQRRFPLRAAPGQKVTPIALAVGDFNGDGNLDLASLNLFTADVSILLGDGHGNFQELRDAAGQPLRFPVGPEPSSIVAADFNHDGHLDLATTSTKDGTVSILDGVGDGTFRPQRTFAAGDTPSSVVAGEFTGNGRLDLAVADSASNQVSLLLGTGDGSFQPPVVTAVGTGPSALAAGDINGDGRLDLVSANQVSNNLSVLVGLGDGRFQTTGTASTATPPFGLAIGEFHLDGSQDPVDFNRDGHADLATVNPSTNDVSVFLGRGDGTFQAPLRYPVGNTPVAIATADFNGDGIPDLAVADFNSNDVTILLGLGDGRFQELRDDQGQPLRFKVGDGPTALVAADFDGDGLPDLATANQRSNDVSILLNMGGGRFRVLGPFPDGGQLPTGLVAGDFNSDGHIDLAVSNFNSNNVSVLLLRPAKRPDGTPDVAVDPSGPFPTGKGPTSLAVGPFTRRGVLDLATSNGGVIDPTTGQTEDDVSILEANLDAQGKPDGTFQEITDGQGNPQRFPVGSNPVAIVAGYFNGDGLLDLATADLGSNDVSVLLAQPGGGFADDQGQPRRYAVGNSPVALVADDFTGDGLTDLATADNGSSSTVTLLRGLGDGTFQPLGSLGIGTGASSLVAGDFQGDGRLDLVSLAGGSDQVAVQTGLGDGTFADPHRFPVGGSPSAPTAVITGDFNGDGRLDLAVADALSQSVDVFLGRGDGTFVAGQQVALPLTPDALVAGDFDGDHRLDLAAADFTAGTVVLLLQQPDGTFRVRGPFTVGPGPVSLVAGDFNGDGITDLAVADSGSGTVEVLLGQPDGNLRSQPPILLGDNGPDFLTAGDFTGNGRLDLAVASRATQQITLLLGNGDGTFQLPQTVATGIQPLALLAGDFTGDGRADLVSVDAGSGNLEVFLGQSGGLTPLPAAVSFPVGPAPLSLVAGDFNGDGHLDLAGANALTGAVTVFLGLGNGQFVAAGTTPRHQGSDPLVADLDGNHAPDVTVINRQGQILFRRGRPGQPGVFDAPRVVNPGPDQAALAVALVATPTGPQLAALDARQAALSLYAPGPGGRFTRQPGPALPQGTLPLQLAAGDLNGDGLGDLVVAGAGSGTQLLVYLQNPHGGFRPDQPPSFQASLEAGPAQIALIDLDSDGLPDIVLTMPGSGEVSVFRNLGGGQFAAESRYRAGTGPYGVNVGADSVALVSAEGTTGLAAGRFQEGTGPNPALVVTNSSSDSFSLLLPTGIHGLGTPQAAQTFATGSDPTAVAVGDFNGDGHLDVAVLNEGSADISIFLGDGSGGFAAPREQPMPLDAGNLPTGLSVADVNGDGILDLVVSNEFGDVLTLFGNGDGTFQPFQRLDRNISLAVADLNGNGTPDFVFGNQAFDRVAVQLGPGAKPLPLQQGNGLLAPGAVQLADLNGDGLPDLVVANSGSNDVLVYLGEPGGQFDVAHRLSFFTGTNPASVTIADVNGDGIPDLVVADTGSNDVTILLGQGRGPNWTLTPGPRLHVGQGPVATVVTRVPGDPFPDLLVTDSQSNDVYWLRGLGNGFFDDLHPTIFDVGSNPQEAFVGSFDGRPGPDLVTINALSNDLTLVSDFPAAARTMTIASGGTRPLVGLEGDFSHNGESDLVVLNNGNGVAALFVGTPGGLELASTVTNPDLHFTDVALASQGSQALNLYATTEGEESVIDLAFNLAAAQQPVGLPVVLTPTVPTGGNGFGSPTAQQVIVLRPQQNGVLALAATLETEVSLDTAEGGQTGEDNGAPLAAGGSSGGDYSDPVADLDSTQDESRLLEKLSGRGEALLRGASEAVGQIPALLEPTPAIDRPVEMDRLEPRPGPPTEERLEPSLGSASLPGTAASSSEAHHLRGSNRPGPAGSEALRPEAARPKGERGSTTASVEAPLLSRAELLAAAYFGRLGHAPDGSAVLQAWTAVPIDVAGGGLELTDPRDETWAEGLAALVLAASFYRVGGAAVTDYPAESPSRPRRSRNGRPAPDRVYGPFSTTTSGLARGLGQAHERGRLWWRSGQNARFRRREL